MEKDHKKTYIVTAVWLAALTVAEVLILEIPMPKAGQVALLLAFAVTKMMLVLMIYMHLRYETKALKIALFVPVPVAILFLVSLMYDIPYQWIY